MADSTSKTDKELNTRVEGNISDIPITFEQPGTGARIRSTGVGEVLSLSKLNQSSLRLAIKRVLEENSYRKNAKRIKQSILQADGAKQAANIIEQVIKPQYCFVARANQTTIKY